MEDLMATTLDLPTKRSSEEMGSGSSLDLDLEALKKQRVDSLEDLDHRSGDLDIIEDPLVEWRRHLYELDWRCKTQERHYYNQAKEIQSSEHHLASNIDPEDEFRNKGWILRTNPGRNYSDYERLYVGDDTVFCYDELTGQYSSYFLSRDDDLSLLEFYKALRSSVTVQWDSSRSDAQRIVDGAKPKYPGIEPFLALAVQETISWKKCEQAKKEWVPLFTKLFQEVVRNKRDFLEVLTEIKENDAHSFPFYKEIIEGNLSREVNVESMGLKIALDAVDQYINAATKGEYSDEELIRRFCSLNGPSVYTYADYVEKKMEIAAKLGVTTNRDLKAYRTVIEPIALSLSPMGNGPKLLPAA